MQEEQIVQQLRGVSRQLVRELGIVGERHPTVPCTVTEGHILIELEAAHELTIGELAARLALDKSTTSRAVASLATRRRVTEMPDTQDLRRKRFRLTKTGQRLVTRIHEQANERVAEALSLLGPGEAQDILHVSRRYARALQNARATSEIQLREITPADNRAVMALISDTRNEHRHIIGNEAVVLETAEHDIHALYAGRGRTYFVVVHDGSVVGGGGFSPLDGDEEGTCELQRMYFRPEIRGLGLGYRVVSRCLLEAARAGYSACYAETMAGMERANRLYEKSGFERLGSPLGSTGHTFTDAWFLKTLD